MSEKRLCGQKKGQQNDEDSHAEESLNYDTLVAELDEILEETVNDALEL